MIEENKKKGGIHWLSVLILFAIDTSFFGANAVIVGGTAGAGVVASPVVCFFAFVATTIGVFFIQRFTVEEEVNSAFAKAFGLGVLAGIPTSIASTSVGTVLLVKAGIKGIWKKQN